jgi:hypothetical protein
MTISEFIFALASEPTTPPRGILVALRTGDVSLVTVFRVVMEL